MAVCALFEALSKPSKGLLKRLDVASHRFFKGQRLVPRLRFEAGLLLLTTMLGLASAVIGLASNRVIFEPLTIAIIEFGMILALLALPAYKLLKLAARSTKLLSWLGRPLGMLGGLSTIIMALPLYIIASFHLYAGRLFLKAGELNKIGIEPIPPAARRRPSSQATNSGQETTKRKAA